MSKLSFYENSWLNLVFEGKNKEYGAYQLRQNSDRTTAQAFLVGLLFVASVIGIPSAISHFTKANNLQIALPDYTHTIVKITNYKPIQPQKPKQQVVPIQRKKTTEIDNSVPLKDPTIVKPEDATPNIATHPATLVIPDSGEMTISNGTATSGSGTTTTSNTTPTDTGTMIATTATLDKLPEFPGGINKFYTYVGNNFSRPEVDEVKTVRVYVSFVIEKDGSMTDIQVRRDPGYGLGREAIRVLKSLKTKWEPGMIAGKPVRTAYNLPITVQMQ
jgi:hypothetical protein